ncbi:MULTISPECIES: diacylglycerol kinase family protein [unclassified Arthrobacter]|uniref:diacylglycerol/lipid kinase family protein n=1 Tax=unclassified Arthrobacter TaxID=235627 RepID=UPI001E56C3CA|nr:MULTISPECIES: diacylglycerol kinase family protein [unclassified Arthrobacter]MCC9144636.1 diacylglycerol kinase family lipid kinase [Arthrobacter sp. zg-Y919]MDK1275862.1 diacylglycerol kinase family protein [Arthrobacter sp. zg.Y919]MDM7990279.1 diacylglycerol kinase family protein [Arthrobacter sp. zg-Y877]WIB02778.1 diacylglycerol kinase family protein [Arthrobacter sp. zg-Y919]
MTSPETQSRPRAAVIVNPIKKTDFDVRVRVAEICADEGWDEPLFFDTEEADPGHSMARKAMEAGVDLVIAAGGDGTVRCVAAELAGTSFPMGLLPLGTGNLLARNLDIGVDDPEQAVRAALNGTERRIDVVHVTVDEAVDSDTFLVMAGLGYDAGMMADTKDALKDKIGWLAYVDAGIRNLPGKPVKTTISIDGGKPIHRRLRSVMGGNCGKITGGLEIFPGARLDDGLLDILTLAPKGKLGWLGVVTGLLRRGKGSSTAVEYYQCKRAEVWADSPLDFEMDGDHLGNATHILFEMDANALRIRMPHGKKDPAVLTNPVP